MKRSKIKFEEIIDIENCKIAITLACLGKKKMRYHIDYAEKSWIYDILDNKEKYAKKLQKFLIGVLNGEEHFHQGNIEIINNDGSRKKERELCKPRLFPDQCAHWAIMRIVCPVLKKNYYEYTCASIIGRGTHYAKKYVNRCLNKKDTKYCAQFDIKGFYKNIDKEILYNKLERKIKDKRILILLKDIIYSYEKNGLPLGYYTSAILANFYLTDFDKYIKEKLKVKYLVRYMDDFLILGSNKRQLHKYKIKIEKYLKEKVDLKLKQNWQVFRLPYKKKNKEITNGRFIDFVGFRFYRYKTTIRRSIYLRMTRTYRKIIKGKYNLQNAFKYASYNGYLVHTNSEEVNKKYIYHKMNVLLLKNIIREYSREINRLRKECLSYN